MARWYEIGRPQPGLAGQTYRVWQMTTFDYILIYDPVEEPVRVARMVHAACDLSDPVKTLRD